MLKIDPQYTQNTINKDFNNSHQIISLDSKNARIKITTFL